MNTFIPKNKIQSLIIYAFFLCLLAPGCSEPDPIKTNALFLGHKGGGSNNYNDINMENTLSAMQEGVQDLDGVETDIQMSLDGTLWMYHNENVYDFDCETHSLNYIPVMHDVEIEKIQLCHHSKKDRLYKLSELIDLWNSTPAGFYISLDIKTSFSRETFEEIGGKNAYLVKLADNLAETVKTMNHPGKLLIEIDSKLFCDQLRSYPVSKGIKFFLMRFVDIDQRIEFAEKLGYDGITLNYTDESISREKIKTAQNSGILVMLWTPYYRDELLSAIRLSPDFIQTDNLRAKTGLNIQNLD